LPGLSLYPDKDSGIIPLYLYKTSSGMLKKETILEIKNVYTAHAFRSASDIYVGAGSETEPVVQLYDLVRKKTEQVKDCPGGMMSFLPVPGQAGSFVSIMGLFPPFIGREAGLYLHRITDNGWKTTKMLDLPFAHRCEFLQHGGQSLLVAATVSKHKDEPADWSRPGEIHVVSLEGAEKGRWGSKVMDPGIIRNHGMIKTSIDGQESVFVSGAEGIFALSFSPTGKLEINQVFDKEVSEMAFVDLDGDGSSELVAIEPFHGNALNVYKRIDGDWELKYSDPIAFGHGLSGGLFNGHHVIVVGNRSDSLALETFTVDDLDKGIVNRMVIEENAGPTQTQVFRFGDTDYVLSANQRKNEVALYSGSLNGTV
jgi:hypothetical protein